MPNSWAVSEIERNSGGMDFFIFRSWALLCFWIFFVRLLSVIALLLHLTLQYLVVARHDKNSFWQYWQVFLYVGFLVILDCNFV